MAFRQSNEVFTIHVDAYELIADLREVAAAVGIKKVLSEVDGPHFVYWLGPHIGPSPAAGDRHQLPSGPALGVYRSAADLFDV